MQGMLANPEHAASPAEYASDAVNLGDALLARLAETEPNCLVATLDHERTISAQRQKMLLEALLEYGHHHDLCKHPGGCSCGYDAALSSAGKKP